MHQPAARPGVTQIVREKNRAIRLPKTDRECSAGGGICKHHTDADEIAIVLVGGQIKPIPNRCPSVGCWRAIISDWEIHSPTKEPGMVGIAAAKLQLHGFDTHVGAM